MREASTLLSYCSKWKALLTWSTSTAGTLPPGTQPLISLCVKKPAGFYFVFCHPESGFLEHVEGNCSAHARFCHWRGVTKHAYHLLHYNCEVFPSPLSLYSILDLGPNYKSPGRQGSVKSAAFSLLPLRVEELSREERAHPVALAFPFLSPFSPYIMSLLMVSLKDSSCLRLSGLDRQQVSNYQIHFVVTIDCCLFFSCFCYSFANLSEGLKVWHAISVCIIYL